MTPGDDGINLVHEYGLCSVEIQMRNLYSWTFRIRSLTHLFDPYQMPQSLLFGAEGADIGGACIEDSCVKCAYVGVLVSEMLISEVFVMVMLVLSSVWEYTRNHLESRK